VQEDARSALSRINRSVTLNGEHGAIAIRTIEPIEGSWNRSTASSEAASASSVVSTTESGGSPPSRSPRSMEPRQGWKRTPSSRATSIATANRSPAPAGWT
jgi:hypothetical protein